MLRQKIDTERSPRSLSRFFLLCLVAVLLKRRSILKLRLNVSRITRNLVFGVSDQVIQYINRSAQLKLLV